MDRLRPARRLAMCASLAAACVRAANPGDSSVADRDVEVVHDVLDERPDAPAERSDDAPGIDAEDVCLATTHTFRRCNRSRRARQMP